MKEMIERMSQINKNEISDILSSISDKVMNRVYKEWVLQLLKYRKEWLMNWYTEVK